MTASHDAVPLTPELLRNWPLPWPSGEAEKESRGRVVIVGGAVSMPGVLVLAGTAALRAGAGKLQMATCRSVAGMIAMAVPESRVFGLPETDQGGIDPVVAAEIAGYANAARATLIGPGMVDRPAVERLINRFLPHLDETVLVLDAMAMECAAQAPDQLRRTGGNLILTPNAVELATMMGLEKQAVLDDPLAAARQAAQRFQAVVAAKGSTTYVAGLDGESYCFRSNNIGMATSGSGDTLSGVVAGLAARGAPPLQALAWGVYLHGTAGDRLARKIGSMGFLARELLAEIPQLMAELEPPGET